jgi:transcriptional regulator with XRE-family HTH domain
MSPSVDVIGVFLRKARLAKKLRSRDVARKLGVSAPHYSRWENGRGAVDPSYDKRLSDILGVAIADLQAARSRTSPLPPASVAKRFLSPEDKEFLWGIQARLDHWMDEETVARLLAHHAPSPEK